jgi:serine/threonine-protein kinase
MRALFVGALLVLGAASAAPARADEPSPMAVAAAETAFDEAKRLLRDKRYEEACRKLEESQRLAGAPGTLLNLGDCYEKVGRTASAWVTFRSAASAARSKGQRAREAEARERAARIEPQLTRLRIGVPPEARVPGLEVRQDEVVLGEELWGLPTPVDPGKVRVAASAPGYREWSRDVDVAAAGATIVVLVPPLSLAPKAAVAAPPPAGTPDEGLGTQRTAALVVGGVGVAALVVGSIFGIDAIAKNNASNADDACDDAGFCNPDGLDLRASAITRANLSTGFFIGGAVALAAGAVLWVTAPRGTATPGARRGRARLELAF